MSTTPPNPDRPAAEAPRDVAELAAALPPLIRIGTSSWNYPGWLGQVYAPPFPTRHAPSQLLRQYVQHPLFRTVGIDHSFYRPMDTPTLAEYADALPSGFLCVSKAWQRITSPVDEESNEPNPDFLDASRMTDAVVAPLVENFADHLGPIVLEFESLARAPWLTPDQFIEKLDRFLDRIPRTVNYAVEIRNPALLTAPYFAVLRAHSVSHCFNAWTDMPSIAEQMALPDSTTADFLVARALLTRGRKYRTSVKEFEPYDRIQKPAPEVRNHLTQLMDHAVDLRIPVYVLVNNRLEGSAPSTIRAVAEQWVAAHAGDRSPKA